MPNSSINKNSVVLTLIFVVAGAIMFFLMGITYKHLENLSKNSEMVTNTYSVSIDIEKLYTSVKDIETLKRDYILTQDDSLIKIINIREKNIDKIYQQLLIDTKDNQEQQKNLNQLNEMIIRKYKIVNEALVLDFADLDKSELRKNLLAGRTVMKGIKRKIDEMLSIEGDLLLTREKKYDYTKSTSPIIIYIISIVSLAILGFSFYKIIKDLKNLSKANNNLLLGQESSKLSEEIGNFGKWEWNINYNTYKYSDNLYRLLGHEPLSSDATLDFFMNHIHPEDRNYVDNIVTGMLKNKSFHPFKYRIIKDDNKEIRYFFANNKLIKDKSGNEILLGTTTDITEQVKANLKIEERNKELEASNKELQAFNYVASHDLQEPLRKIETFISRLIDKDYDHISDSGKQYVDRILSSAGRMRILINDLLQFSRTSRNDQKLENTDLNEKLNSAIAELNQTIEEKKATITIPENLPTIKAVPFQMQQLFINIIGNSLKYSKKDIPTKIDITLETVDAKTDLNLPKSIQGKFFKINFTDNGIGFEQEFAHKIFELFSRLHGKTDYIGTGIGLAICKKIVDNHHGYIFAKGELNVGSTFSVYLPEIS